MNRRPSIRFFLATAISLGLVVSNQLPFPSSGSAAADLNLKSESQLRSEAALYETSIREIGRISNMNLANPDESKAAIAILKRQTPNLKFIRSKLIALGLSDSSFASAVKARTSDKKSAEEFAVELAKDRTAILKLNGAQSLKDRMLRTVESDKAMLRKIADQLKQAAADIRSKAKGHHVVRTNLSLKAKSANPETDSGTSPAPDLSDVGTMVIMVVTVAVIVAPPLGIALVLLSVNSTLITFPVAVAETMAIYAQQLLLLLKAGAGTDKQKDEIEACMDRAYAKCDKCLSDAAAIVVPGTELITVPLYLAASDLCYAQQLLDLLLC